jgi:hypothetical protein
MNARERAGKPLVFADNVSIQVENGHGSPRPAW